MRRQIKYVFMLAVLIYSAVAAQQPDHSADGLLLQLKKSKEDTVSVNLLLQLSEHYFKKASGGTKYLDSALVYEHAAEQLSKKLNYPKGIGNSYEQLSKILHVQNNTAQARQFADKAIEIFKAHNFFLELGYAYYDLSGYYSINNADELTERIRIVEELSFPAFQKSGSTLKEADILKELGDLVQLTGNYSKALSVLHRSLQLYQSIKHPNLEDICDLLGTVYSVTGNNEQALKYGLLAVKAAASINDTTIQLATIFNRIGSTYSRMKKYNAAYDYFQKALYVAKKYNSTETIVLLSSKISRTLIALNKPQEALEILQEAQQKYPSKDIYSQLYLTASFLITYKELRQYQQAQKYCDQLLAISKRLDKYEPDQSEAQYPVTEFYLATHQYELARKHLAGTDTFYKAIQSPLELNHNHYLWFKLDSIQGNYLGAITHYQLYKMLSDSLLNETTSNHIEQLQIAFETQKKDQDIKMLENASKLQQNKLSQANQTRNWVIGAVILLLIIIGLQANNSWIRQQANKKLKAQQKEIEKKNLALQHLVTEKEWLIKEIHHRVKNNFHTVSGLLATQSQYLKTDEAIEAVSESHHRIQAMSLIHQKLYQSENLSAIYMPDYVYELADYLRDSFNIRKSVQFNLQIEPIALNLSHSIPLGLILNEAITNSIKYAFPGNKNGTINISLKYKSERNLLLTISDDGVGLRQDPATPVPQSMGMKLMYGLSEDIDGKFSISGYNGTAISLEFIYDG
ncbi:Two-component sensor histidine kinase, contains HisKA and HATPase domains [Chitinophaga rupis]|uniref:histidine kinase n=1 Tax=Chitinophaga rupis TaxID=573321 RepID=A0A1H7UUB1_9BACT|nr:histidine kinase dimerization/phosphoacceptor domain -containing protein [Chitinophaga rupis]SEM00228.1 Two-component sensor histidine kinase, contains HisKA and HATPase domains [Chitinophaga rupis]